MTDTKLTLDVPTPSTTLEAGAATVPGVYVETDEHVRLYAHGSADVSDAVAMSVGQLWVQAVNDVCGVAAKKAMVTSTGPTFLNSVGTLTVLAGFSPSSIASSEANAGTMPDGVDGYDTSAAIATGLWSAFGIAMGVVAVAANLTQLGLGNSLPSSHISSAKINIAGALANFVAMGSVKNGTYPGVNLFSQGGTYIGCSFGATWVIGVAGTLMASTFINTFSLLMTKMRGYNRASVLTCGSMDISANFGAELKAAESTTISARTGDLAIFATDDVRIGTPDRPITLNEKTGPWPTTVETRPFWKLFRSSTYDNPQKVTSSITFAATDEVLIDADKDIFFRTEGVKSTSVKETKVDGESSIRLSSETMTVTLDYAQIVLGSHEGAEAKSNLTGRSRMPTSEDSDKAYIKIDSSGITFASKEMKGSALFTSKDATLATLKAALKVTSSSAVVSGDEVKFQ